MTHERSGVERRSIPRDEPGRRREDDARWLSLGAYAREWGISRQTIYKWLDAELLEHYRFDGMVRIRNIKPCDHHPYQLGASS